MHAGSQAVPMQQIVADRYFGSCGAAIVKLSIRPYSDSVEIGSYFIVTVVMRHSVVK
jgi:hypothetical protein